MNIDYIVIILMCFLIKLKVVIKYIGRIRGRQIE